MSSTAFVIPKRSASYREAFHPPLPALFLWSRQERNERGRGPFNCPTSSFCEDPHTRWWSKQLIPQPLHGHNLTLYCMFIFGLLGTTGGGGRWEFFSWLYSQCWGQCLTEITLNNTHWINLVAFQAKLVRQFQRRSGSMNHKKQYLNSYLSGSTS